MSAVALIILAHCRNGWLRLLLLAEIAAGSIGTASAHDLFTAFIQHRVHLTVGARHLDLTMDLTFFEERSSRERRRMDADTNGHITRIEVEAYRKALAPALLKQVRLLVVGQELPLATLFEPEVDLLGNNTIGPGHHRLRLFFFARTPAALQADDEIVIEDRLWSEVKALASVEAEGRDGCRLEIQKPRDPGSPPAKSGAARTFTLKCLEPPTTPPQTQEPSRPDSINDTSHPGATRRSP